MIYQQKLRQKVKRNYTNQVNQTLSRCFPSVFSENLWGGHQLFFECRSCMYQQLLGFMIFTLNLKNKIAKIP